MIVVQEISLPVGWNIETCENDGTKVLIKYVMYIDSEKWIRSEVWGWNVILIKASCALFLDVSSYILSIAVFFFSLFPFAVLLLGAVLLHPLTMSKISKTVSQFSCCVSAFYCLLWPSHFQPYYVVDELEPLHLSLFHFQSHKMDIYIVC
jgi:hypothetical protein